MTLARLLTTGAILALAGTAQAGCFGSSHETTAQIDMTPIPTAEVETTPQIPAPLLPLITPETDEG